MGKKIFITNLQRPQYIGIAQSTVLDSYGFNRREFRIDYSGACDVGIQQVEILPLLSNIKNRPKHIMVGQLEKKEDEYHMRPS